MCGFVGCFGHIDSKLFQNSLQCIEHRGPDDRGLFFDEKANVSLGHVRLSIQDISPLGHQPMVSDDASVVLVFNGEIYNFRELRAQLLKSGHKFRGDSDTEVLMKLYLDKGERMLPLLNGIFTFIFWDKRNQTAFIARDGVGVKPLYFTESPTMFAVASEMKALMKLMPQTGQLDTHSLHRYLSFLWCPGEGTPLKNVRKLQPGEAMTVHKGQLAKRWQWYKLPVFHEKNTSLSQLESINQTETFLRQAVHRQLVADVDVGAFLSGGLDSSAIVAFAKEQVNDIRCFTIESPGGQEEGMVDDLPYARRVAKHLGVSLDVVKVDSNSIATDLEKMVMQLDEPLADPAPLNVFYISQLAKSQGIKVLLSGAGGDDVFSGYRRHYALQLEKIWSWLPHSIRSGLGHATQQLDSRKPFQRRLAKLFNGAHLNGDARLINYFRWANESTLYSLYTPDFREQLGDSDPNSPMHNFLQPLSSKVTPLERMLALEQRFFLSDHNLMYTDKMSMAAGVEVRVPFLDNDLMEFAAQIPAEYKQRRSEGKWVLKKAMEPYLPHDVIYRPKSGFGVPLRHWMRYDLRELLGDLLSTESLVRRGLFLPPAVHKLIADNNSGKVDASYILLSILCIEIWCRAYVDP